MMSTLPGDKVETERPRSIEGPQNQRQILHEAEIESGGPMTDEARRQLEQNIIRQENYP